MPGVVLTFRNDAMATFLGGHSGDAAISAVEPKRTSSDGANHKICIGLQYRRGGGQAMHRDQRSSTADIAASLE